MAPASVIVVRPSLPDLLKTRSDTPLKAKLKVHLKLSISRLRIVQQKDQALAKQQRRAMAQLLEVVSSTPPSLPKHICTLLLCDYYIEAQINHRNPPQQGKFESARIRVENIIRSDLTTELHEILELYCELLLARINLLLDSTVSSSSPSSTAASSPCDPGLEEAVKSILYAAPRTDVKELNQTRVLLVERFGKDFAAKAAAGEGVPDRVLRKLRVEPPGSGLVESYLKAIASAYDVKYGDDEDDEEGAEDNGESGGEAHGPDGDGGDGGGAKEGPVPASNSTAQPSTNPLSLDLKSNPLTPPRSLPLKSPLTIAPPSPTTDNANPRVRLPPGGTPSKTFKTTSTTAAAQKVVKAPDAGIGGGIPDVDDLEKRFSLLKK